MMAKSGTRTKREPRPAPEPSESAPVWFAQLVEGLEDNDLELAAEAQKQLRRLGWECKRTNPGLPV
ncbi:hypothetical protein Pan216_21310 [Planctomycetes bacterium Pan216]|uniref:Uncharacterized protein n=1 Tax=Kolteria novifilia TaxID=2527975 RepID=A0A518B2R8_9BACT|nr:hypothetical protein Pan216_21310 [Planctomycetes bacterium Pan216]